jgi:hypothetical protein
MNVFRYYLALLLTVCLPPLLLYWLILHPFVRFWRRLGPPLSLGVAWIVVGLGAAGIFALRDFLLTVDYSTNWVLCAAGVVCLLAAGWLRRKLQQHFSIRTLLGLPELAPERYRQPLVTRGTACPGASPAVSGIAAGAAGLVAAGKLPDGLCGVRAVGAGRVGDCGAGGEGTAGAVWA